MDRELPTFANLFKKFRLRSGFATLSEFGDSLASEGLVYEDSLFSHWQKGDRVPTNRNLMLAVLNVFTQKDGISTMREANMIMESAGMGNLTEREQQIFSKLIKSGPFLAPISPSFFVDRNKELQTIRKILYKRKPILLWGTAGVGKSALITYLAHQIRHEYKDGVLYAKVDSSTPSNILQMFALAYHENINYINDTASRASYIQSLLSNKEALIILDNVLYEKDIEYLIPPSSCQLIITSRQKNINSIENLSLIHLDPFTEDDVFLYFVKKLGRSYAVRNEKVLFELGKILGNLPLALALIINRLSLLKEYELPDYVEKVRKNVSAYLQDNNIKKSFDISYNILSDKEKQVFSSLSIFEGYDFPIEVVVCINKLTSQEGRQILLTLVNYSLVQESGDSRYKLHPLLKEYAKEKLIITNYYERALKFFLKRYEKYHDSQRIDIHHYVNKEIDNIFGLMNGCIANRQYSVLFKVWEYVWVALWDYGFWDKSLYYINTLLKATKTKRLNGTRLKYLIDLSLLNIYNQKYKKAENIIDKVLRDAIKSNNHLIIALAFARKGLLHRQQNKSKIAIAEFNKALTIFKRIKENFRVMNALYNIAYCYYKKGDYTMAQKIIQDILKLEELKKYPRMQSILFCVSGMINYAQNKINKAKIMFSRSLKINKTNGFISWVYLYNRAVLKIIKSSDPVDKNIKYIEELIKQSQPSLLVEKLSDLKQIIIRK